MQQVNLYLPEFRPRREPLLAAQIAVLTVLVVAIMTILGLLGAYENQALEAKILARQERVQSLDVQVQAIRVKMPKDNSTSLERENTKLEREIEKRRLLQELLVDKNLGNSAGFSAQLEGLARQRLDALSLDTFSLLEGGRYLEMSGWLRDADQLPLYLQNLRKEPGFELARFGVMSIERDRTRSDAMKFQLKRPGAES